MIPEAIMTKKTRKLTESFYSGKKYSCVKNLIILSTFLCFHQINTIFVKYDRQFVGLYSTDRTYYL